MNTMRDESGTTAVEYAVFLGMIAGAVLVAAMALGWMTRSSYLNLAQAVYGPAGGGAGRIPAVSSPADDQRPGNSAALAAWIGLGAVTSAAAIIWLLRRRPIKQSAPVRQPIMEIEDIGNGPLFANRQRIRRQLSVLSRINEHTMLVRHVHTASPLCVTPSTTVSQAEKQMIDNCCRHSLVCQDRVLVGIISDRDVRGRRGYRAKTIMTRDPLTVTPDTPVFLAVSLLIQNHISCLPVLDHGKPVGIITSTDIMMALQCAIRMMSQDAEGAADGCTRPSAESELCEMVC